MKNILYEGYLGPRLPREVQLKRVQRVMQEELTPLQRETLIAFYFQEQTLTAPFYRPGSGGRAGRAWGSRSSLTFGDFGDRL